MKIVINALSARIGGGQTYLKNLLSRLPDEPELDILVFAPESIHFPSDRRIRRGKVTWFFENPLLRALWEYFVLSSILSKEKTNVLFCPGGVVFTNVPARCKTVTMFRNMIPFDSKALRLVSSGTQKLRNYLLKPIMLRSMANADLTIFISNHARQVIEALIPVVNAVTIPHGINAEFSTHDKVIARPIWLPPGEYLLYVSRFDVYKHHLEVALAYSDLPEALRSRYKLVLVGEADNALARQVVDLAREKGLHNHILVVGPIAYDDLPPLYHHATVNLFASSCENCPNILLEALGAGRPVLSSCVMPMPEFGSNAVAYFSPTNPISIRDELAKVLYDESRMRNLSAASARRSADFDWVDTAHATWRCLTKLAIE